MEGNSQTQRVTNFYIETILRPDFGRSGKDREGGRSGGFIQRHEGSKSSKEPQRDRGEHRGTAEEHGAECEARRPEQRPGEEADKSQMLWPAWVYCTRYSDRPSSGPRSRKPKRSTGPGRDDKRPRTAFTAEQLLRLKAEFQKNRYLTEQRRQSLSQDLGLNESQIKIWFQNKRAKIKKNSGNKNALALHLMAQGLYNHSTNQPNHDSSNNQPTDSE